MGLGKGGFRLEIWPFLVSMLDFWRKTCWISIFGFLHGLLFLHSLKPRGSNTHKPCKTHQHWQISRCPLWPWKPRLCQRSRLKRFMHEKVKQKTSSDLTPLDIQVILPEVNGVFLVCFWWSKIPNLSWCLEAEGWAAKTNNTAAKQTHLRCEKKTPGYFPLYYIVV